MAPVIRLEPRWGTRRQAAEEELELEEVARRRPAPCKVLRTQASSDPDARDEWGNRPTAPTKLTQYDVGNAMPPDQALRYAEWIGARSSRWDSGPGSGQPHLARRASSPSAGASDSDVSDGALASAFGFLERSAAGQPLPDELARQLSAELGLDVSAARLHTDAAAAAAAAAVGARAFTLGHDIFFAAGAYDPHTTDGLELLAHEVAHVAQHLRGSAPPGAAAGRKVSRPDDAHEHQADDFARRFRARSAADPATIVNDVRAKGTRGPLPFQADLEHHFGTSFDFVETYSGEAAKLAGQLLSASAFALRNIVVLADPSPQRETLLHELTHVLQMGQQRTEGKLPVGTVKVGVRGSDVEREASAAPAAPTAAAPADTIHREETPAPLDLNAALGTYAAARRSQIGDNLTGALRAEVRLGVLNGGYLSPRLYKTTGPLTGADFVSAVRRQHPSARPEDLVAAHTQFGAAHKLAQVTKRETPTFVFFADNQAVTEVDSGTPTTQWNKYKDAVTRLAVPTFKWPQNGPHVEEFIEWDPTFTENEAGKYREALRDAIAGMTRFKDSIGNWNDYYKNVVCAQPPLLDNRMRGDIFAKITAETSKTADKNFTDLEAGDPIFDAALYGLDVGAHGTAIRGDGTATFSGAKHEILVECKAMRRGPSALDIRKARNYKLVLDQQGFGYKYDGNQITQHQFNHIVYIINDATSDKRWVRLWYQMLFVDAGDGAPIFTREQASLVPPLESEPAFTFQFNPTFRVPLGSQDDPRTHYVLSSPPLGHPGVEFQTIDITVDPSKTQLVSGAVTLDLAAGDLQQTGVVKPLTPATGAEVMATADNRLSGVTSGLSDLLGRVSVDASLVDTGVQATFTIDASDMPAIAGFQVDAVTLTARYTEAGLAVDGTLTFHHRSGKMAGQVGLAWANGWSFSGELTVEPDIVPGLSGFTATFEHAAGTTTIGIGEIAYEKRIGAVTLTGTARDLSYDVTAGSFSGNASLRADLGMFGQAGAEATITNNALTGASFSYDSPEFKYPADSASPTFTGTVGGTITYTEGAFSGSLRGTAGLNIPALQSLVGEGGLGLALEGSIDAEGRYSGSISTTSPINLGDHFQIPSISCLITPEGEVEGDFNLRVVNFRHLDNVEIGLHVDRNGVSVRQAAASITFGTEADRFWGTLSASYAQESGLSITGNLSARIKEGMVATGTLTYSSTTNEVEVSLTVEEITLLQHGPVTKTLFEFTRQIPLINAYGIGIYLDIGFDLGFSYQFDLRLQPTISLEGFSLETFEFERAAAEIELRGELVASLTATPRVGLGLFALSPSLLRGGGGVTIPIVGAARLLPTGTLTVAYTPDGGVSGDATLGMPLTFGITGSVVPYAELSLLDGVWNPSWTGEALTEFEIMPPKELFNFQLDLGGDLTQQDPVIPDAPQAPSAASGPQLAQQAPETTTSAASTGGGRDTEVPTTGPSGEAGGGGLPTEPVNLGGLSSGLQGLQGYQTIAGFMDRAGAAWGAIGDFFGRVVGVFRDFLVSLGDGVQEIIDGFVANGLGYLPQLLRRMVGDTAWTIIEPIITALTSSAEALLGLFETTPPTGITDFFPWALRLAASAWGMAFDSIGSLVSAIQTMFDRLGQVATQLVTTMVNQGMVGVKRHHYYIWYVFGTSHFFVANQYKINLLGVSIDYWDQGGVLNPASAVAIGLFEVLERMGVPTVGSYFDPEIGEESRDRWA
jgi:hypothetical protein